VGEHVVASSGNPNDRGVKGSAAQVVDDNVLLGTPWSKISEVAVHELYCGGGRFVHHAQHIEAGPPECLHGDVALVAVGIGRGRYHHLDRPPLVEDEVAMLGNHPLYVGKEECEELHHRGGVTRDDLHRVIRPEPTDQAFQRAQQVHFGVLVPIGGIPAKAQGPVLHGNKGRNVLFELPLPREGADGIIPVFHRCDHGAGCSEIDSESHSCRFLLFLNLKLSLKKL